MTEALAVRTTPGVLPEHSRQGLQSVLTGARGGAIVRREYSHKTCVAMPLHGDPHRLDTVETTLHSLGSQVNTDVHVVIANNGILPAGVERVTQSAARNGVQVSFVDAPPQNPGMDAAYARNTALASIEARGEHDESFRGPVLLLDSDTAIPDPQGIERLRDTIYAHENAVGVSGKVQLVADLAQAYAENKNAGTHGSVKALPSLWKDGHVDLASIVAFSSTVAGKTTGFMLDTSSVVDLIKDPDKGLYVRMPYGSAEDMMASTSLTRRGTIYQHPDVTIIDEARPSPDQTMKQQINWGRDHVLLLQCLKEMGLSKPGIQVLEPWGNKWAQWTMPGTQAFHGVLINPSELHDLAVSEAAYKFMLEQDILSCDQILYGMQTLARLTQGAELTRSHAEDINVRSDLPTPLQTDPRNDRFSPASQYGRLIGNIAGIYDILESTSPTAESFPEVFLFGNRQSADWV